MGAFKNAPVERSVRLYMGEEYKISLGVDINESQLNNIKQTLKNITDQKREVIYNVDFNIKNANKLVEVGKEIERIKTQLGELKNIGSTTNVKSAIPIDAKNIEQTLNKINESIKKVKNSLGTVDSKRGVQSLLTTVNHISKALEKVSRQFESLNSNLSNLSSKDFSLNFDFGFGASKKNPEQILSELRMLKKEAEEYEKFFHKYYSLGNRTNDDPISKLLLQHSPNNRLYMHQLRNTMATGEPSEKQIAAYREYIALIKEAASIGKISLAPVDFRLAESGEFVKVKNEVNETEKRLKELFSGGINAEKLSAQLDSIVADLNEIRNALQGLSKNTSIESITQGFNNLSSSIEKLIGNASQAQSVLNNGLNINGIAGTQRAIKEHQQLAQTTTQTADAISQSGQKIQRAFTQMTSAGKLDPLQLKDDIAEADRFSAALSKLKNIQSNLGKIEIGKINTSTGVAQLQTLERQLESLSAEYNETVAEINGMGGISATQFQSFQNQANTTGLKLDQLKSKIIDTKAELANKIEIQLESGKFTTQVQKIHSDAKKLSSIPDKLRVKLDALNNAESAMNSAFKNGSVDEKIASYKKYEATLAMVENQLKQNKIAEQNAIDLASLQQSRDRLSLDMNNWLKDNSAATKQFGGRIKELQVQLKNCDKTTLANLKAEFAKIKKEAQLADKNTQTLGSRLKTQFSKYSTYFSVYSVFMRVGQGLRSMFEQVKLIDSAMTELKKVTDETDASYNQFLSNAASRSKELGTTIDGLVASTADFARLGYGFKESQGLAEVANIYAVVGDEISGVEDATKSLISTLAAYKDEASGISDTDFAMDIVDKFNEVSKINCLTI